MITVKKLSRQEIKEFKEKYSNCEISTEVVSNILQPCHLEDNKEYSKYSQFVDFFSLSGLPLKFLIFDYSISHAKDIFGKCHFKFQGNRTYQLYVFEFDNLTFIGPAKFEVVCESNVDKISLIPKLINFEIEFMNMCLDHIDKNQYDDSYYKIKLNELKKLNFVTEDNKVDFDYVITQNNKLKHLKSH